jgi:Phage tail tube protein, GTA-gp10
MMAGQKGGRANRHRGEIEAMFDGQRRILCLTLGALAELETAFACDNLADLGRRFAGGTLKAADMIRIIGAGLRGGGNLFSDEDVAMMGVDGGIAGCARIVTELLTATFAPQTPGSPIAMAGEAQPANPQEPQQAM